MRKLKFRTYLKEEKKYVFPTMILVDFGIVTGIAYNDIDKITHHPIERRLIIEDVVLEQATGIKDKNGKMIYEGDLVEEAIGGKTVIWEVRYCQSECCFELHYIKGALYGDSLLNDESQYEVIGNIHDDHKLLEDENKYFIPEQVSLCENCQCVTRTLAHEDGSGLFCGKCGADKEK